MSYNLKYCGFYPNNFDASALKEPLGHRTPTEVHVYPDRGTCVLRPRYMRPPTEVHAYPDRDAMTFLKQWRPKATAT